MAAVDGRGGDHIVIHVLRPDVHVIAAMCWSTAPNRDNFSMSCDIPAATSGPCHIRELMDNLDPEGWERVGVSAALARSYAEDEREFLALLGTLMESALGTETRIDRRGFFGGGAIHRIVIALGDYTYVIEDPGRGPLTAARKRVVRGVALKSEDMAVADWIDALGAAIESRAATSQRARDALSKLIGGG